MFPNYYSHKANITKLMIYISVGMFVLTQFNPDFFMRTFSLYPPNPTFSGFIMHAFMHGGFLHILFNMMALSQIGTILEMSMGERRFLVLYLLLLILTGTATLLIGGASYYLGASAIVMGLFAYLYATLPNHMEMIRNQLFSVLMINVLIGLVPGISFVGHLSGAIFGYILGKSNIFNKWRYL